MGKRPSKPVIKYADPDDKVCAKKIVEEIIGTESVGCYAVEADKRPKLGSFLESLTTVFNEKSLKKL